MPEFFDLARLVLMFGPARPIVISVGPARSNFRPARPVVRRLFLVKKTNQTVKVLFYIGKT